MQQRNAFCSCLFLMCVCMVCFCMPVCTHAAAMAAADQGEGYAGNALHKVSSLWSIPAAVREGGQDYSVRIRVLIDGDGKAQECTVVQSSGFASMDTDICATVRKAAPFGTPPYALPITIFMTFWTGEPGPKQSPQKPPVAAIGMQGTPPAVPSTVPATPSAPTTKTAQDRHASTNTTKPAVAEAPLPPPSSTPKVAQGTSQSVAPTVAATSSQAATPQAEQVRYVNDVMQQISPLVIFPQNLPRGTYTVTIAVPVAADGTVHTATLRESCGNTQLDTAVIQAASKIGSVLPPPGGQRQDLRLTFIIQKP